MSGAGTGVSFEINMAGLEAVGSLLDEFVRSASDLKPALKSIGEHIVSETMLNFEREPPGRPGKPWKESARVKATGGQTLSLIGRLKSSFNSRAIKVDNDSVSVGTSVSYAAVHQLGFTGTVQISAHERRITKAFGRMLKKSKKVAVKSHSAKRNIPARPFLPMTLEEIGIGEVERILIRHLVKE